MKQSTFNVVLAVLGWKQPAFVCCCCCCFSQIQKPQLHRRYKRAGMLTARSQSLNSKLRLLRGCGRDRRRASLCCEEAGAKEGAASQKQRGRRMGGGVLLTKARLKWLLNFTMCTVRHFIRTLTKSHSHHRDLISERLHRLGEETVTTAATPIPLSSTCPSVLQTCHPGHAI